MNIDAHETTKDIVIIIAVCTFIESLILTMISNHLFLYLHIATYQATL